MAIRYMFPACWGECASEPTSPWVRAAVERGEADIGGRLPINPSGGLLGKGHPLGGTGVAQVVELVRQLRGEAGDRQIEGARVGLAHCRGGKAVGIEGAACTVQVLVK